MKKPSECKGMDDIRLEIDHIDAEIIALIGKRARYVHAAAKFKKDKISVKAPDRVKHMLSKRRQWAQEQEIDPDFIESVFSMIVDYFISKEMTTWKASKPQDTP